MASESSPSRENQIPETIGPYKIESLLDKGGMSLLYLGIDPTQREPLAIKTLSSKYVSHPEMVQRFMHEAEIIEITNHPNIVRLVGHGQWEEGVYIATEFIQGLSLRQMILQQAMSLKRALEVVIQIGHALTHLHVHGIIHRDLKPENIMLTSQGGVKVVDFGISQLYTAKNSEEQKRIIGTPAYMAPELQKDPSAVSFSSDIFALGVITYELILGRLSHGTIHLSMVPKNMQPVLAKALNPDPKKRFEDIVDFVKALSNYYKSDLVKADMRGSDYMGELNEDIKSAQNLLLPTKSPTWPKSTIGLVSNRNIALSCVYYDFFQQREGVYDIVMAQADRTGVEGIMQVAMLRGMVHALFEGAKTPAELIQLLNERLVAMNEKIRFSFTFLTLYPFESRLAYIALNSSFLSYLPSGKGAYKPLYSNNPALGEKKKFVPLEVGCSWNIGDKILLHNFQTGGDLQSNQMKINEEQFLAALKAHALLAPQNQVEAIARRLFTEGQRTTNEQAVTMISCERTG